MAFAIEMKAGSIPSLRKKIAEMRGRVELLDPILKQRAALLATLIDDSFQKGRSPTGEAWAPLAASTIDSRRKGSSTPLVDTGMLRMSSHAGAEGQKIVFGVSGAASRYGVFHVSGTSNMPRRSFLPMDSEGNPDFSEGPAADWLEKTNNQVIAFILHGKNTQ